MRHESEKVEFEKEKAVMTTRLKQVEEYSESSYSFFSLFVCLFVLIVVISYDSQIIGVKTCGNFRRHLAQTMESPIIEKLIPQVCSITHS